MIPKHILDALGENSLLAMGYSSPNPPVASVITDMNDRILSTGSTQKVGGNHAEREAYEKCGDMSKIPHKIYITLEPCSHFGRTPPCVDLLILNKPRIVYLGLRDPNPLVKERDSVQLLIENSIEVVFSLEIEEIAREFLSGFLSRITNAKPRIFIKAALSNEGFFKSSSAKSYKLSNEESDNISQFIRQSVDAIIVGSNTVFIDSPQLNFRGIKSTSLQDNINNSYFMYLRNLIKSSHLVNLINHRNNQPIRIYCISRNKFPMDSFFEKLNNLDKQKTVFIILGNLEPDRVNLLKSLTENEILFNINNLSMPDFIFSKFSFNSILVEGGNFLYSEFGSILSEQDYIIEIHSKKNIESGSTPNFKNEKIRTKESFMIKNDKWTIRGI